MEHLPFVLLGLRCAVQSDAACSPSDLLYGSPLRLPGPMISPPSPLTSSDPSDFAARLRVVMKNSVPAPLNYHGTQPKRDVPALRSSTHVFLRVDAVKRPLVPPFCLPVLAADVN